MLKIALLILLIVCASSLAQSTYPPKGTTTTTTPGAPVTTGGPTNPLSNSDGTPCNCNTATMWLDLILIADRSKSIGVGGLGSIGTQLATNLYGINIAQSGSNYYTRVGLIVFSSDVQVIGNLNKYNSYNDLTNDLLNLESYHKADDNVVDIYAALKSAQDMFQTQAANNANRNARQVVLLFASSYNQIGGNNPVVIANQMNNSNIFIITVDYNDAQGAATQLLSQISTPFMNFSSSDSNGLTNTFTEINSALCYSNCVCPASMTQLITYNSNTGRQTYFADCYIAYLSGSFATFAERACEEIHGTLIALQTGSKTNFVINSVANKNNTKLTRFHTGLHRDVSKNWVWYGYQNTNFPLGAFANWAPGFSSSSAGDCAYIEKLSSTTWGWATENCIGQNPYQYVCQVRACDSTYGTCDCNTWKNDPSCS
uniref:C-type lectin domain-containing protein n=1 Tax=Acrobeloides nanus TaxID=290746 RepID=A0A914EM63_9BILA